MRIRNGTAAFDGSVLKSPDQVFGRYCLICSKVSGNNPVVFPTVGLNSKSISYSWSLQQGKENFSTCWTVKVQQGAQGKSTS